MSDMSYIGAFASASTSDSDLRTVGDSWAIEEQRGGGVAQDAVAVFLGRRAGRPPRGAHPADRPLDRLVAVPNGVTGIVGQCGGSLSCATCHVFVASGDFPPLGDEDEDEMLDCTATEREDNSRLSCQLVLAEGQEVCVTVPKAQL
jgi:2Fe-2S ferredoxin